MSVMTIQPVAEDGVCPVCGSEDTRVMRLMGTDPTLTQGHVDVRFCGPCAAPGPTVAASSDLWRTSDPETDDHC